MMPIFLKYKFKHKMQKLLIEVPNVSGSLVFSSRIPLKWSFAC